MFWVLLAVVAFTYVVSPLLQRRGQTAPDADLGRFTPPTAQKGNPIAVVFGTQKIAPNVTWYGNVFTQPIKTTTGNRTLLNPFAVNHSTTTGYKYGADIAGVFCHGPIDELVDIQFDDVSIREVNATVGAQTSPGFPVALPAGDAPLVMTWDAPDLFGGDSDGGGVVGRLELFFGKLTQNASATLAAKLGGDVSRYKGLVHFIWTDTTFGTSQYIKPFFAVVRRCPQLVSPDSATANIGGSANPADAIYEILTDTRWGLGQSPAAIDVASFTAAAVALKAEDLGVDFTITTQSSGEDVIGELLRHVDGALYTHPLTGLLTLALARGGYDVDDLPVINKSNILEFASFKRRTWPETFNEVKVNYVERGTLPRLTFKQNSQPAQNLASVQAMQQVVTTSLSFPFLATGDRALKVAYRELRPLSLPLATAEVTVNRTQHAATVGSLVVVNWVPLGISGLVMRVANVKAGTLEDNSIALTLIEDVFATAPAVFTPPSSTEWTAPSLAAAAPLAAVAIPAPWWLVRADAFVGVNLVVRGNKAATAYDGYFDAPTTSDASPGIQRTTDDPFVPAGTLVDDLTWDAPYLIEAADLGGNGLVIDTVRDMELVAGTSAAGLTTGDRLAVIVSADDEGFELIAYRDVHDNGDGTFSLYGVLRGQFDTLPIDHPAGALVLFIHDADSVGKFWPGFPGAPAPTASSQTASTVGYKGWAASKGLTGPARAPEPPTFKIQQTLKTLTDPTRAVHPYAPGHLTLNGVDGNAIDDSDPLPDTNTLTWVGRNRLTEVTTRAHGASGVSVEAGQTYEVEVWHVSRTTGASIFGLLHTYTGVTSPFTYTNGDFESQLTTANGGAVSPTDTRRTGGGIRFLVRAVVGTLKSYGAAVPGFTAKQITGNPVVPSLQFAHVWGESIDPQYLEAHYESDGAGNVFTGTRLDTWADLSGNANDLTRSAGTPTSNPAQVNGKPSIDFSGAEYFSNLGINVEGSATFFAIMKIVHFGSYHNFFDTLNTMSGNPPMIFWVDGGDALEMDAESNAGNKPIHLGAFMTLVVHHVNASGKMGYKIRINGTQVAADNGVTTGTGTIPGSPGSPASYVAEMFNRGGASSLRAQVAAFGFYGRSKDGTEGALEAYLRAKYATW